MDKKDIYDSVVAELGSSWDSQMPTGCRSLAPVGKDNSGVYIGLPVVIMSTPCLGVMPSRAHHERIGSQYQKSVDFYLDIFFYAFDFGAEIMADQILYMGIAIENIIDNNPNLDGKVDLWDLTDIEWGDMIRRAANGGEQMVAGGVATCLLKDYT